MSLDWDWDWSRSLSFLVPKFGPSPVLTFVPVPILVPLLGYDPVTKCQALKGCTNPMSPVTHCECINTYKVIPHFSQYKIY